jgi:hypothetical protein
MITWAAIMIPLLSIGARFGANAAAVTWVIGFPIVFGVSTWRIAAAFRTEVRVLLRPMWRPALCAAVSCLVVEAAQLQLKEYVPAAAQLAIEIAIGGACYWVLMRQYAHAQYGLVIGLTRRLLRR